MSEIKEIKYLRKYSKINNILIGCTTRYITDSTYYFYEIDTKKTLLFYVTDDNEIVFNTSVLYYNKLPSYSELFGTNLGLTDLEFKEYITNIYIKNDKENKI